MPDGTFEHLVISDSLGIGTDTPNAQLHIDADISEGKVLVESGGNLLKLAVDGAGATIGTVNASPFALQTDGSARLTLNPLGDVGIGKNPTFKLDVNGIINATGFNKGGGPWKLQTGDIEDNAITSAKIADLNVTTAELALGAVTDAKLANNAVTTAKLADGAVVASKIPDGSIPGTKLAAGTATQWETKAAGAIAYAGGNVGIGTRTPAAALHVIGQLLGAAQDTTGKALRIGCGSTPEGATAWQAYAGELGVYVKVDTSGCGFTKTPLYIVSMNGNSYNWETTGGNTAYERTATGFTVYVKFSDSRKFDSSFANSHGWHIQWIAIGE